MFELGLQLVALFWKVRICIGCYQKVFIDPVLLSNHTGPLLFFTSFNTNLGSNFKFYGAPPPPSPPPLPPTLLLHYIFFYCRCFFLSYFFIFIVVVHKSDCHITESVIGFLEISLHQRYFSNNVQFTLRKILVIAVESSHILCESNTRVVSSPVANNLPV